MYKIIQDPRYQEAPTLDDCREWAKSLIAERRYNAEQSGTIDIDGSVFSTSREERMSLVQAVTLGLTSQTRKLVNGTWVTLSSDQIATALTTMQASVQTMYDAEAAEAILIDTLTIDQILARYP